MFFKIYIHAINKIPIVQVLKVCMHFSVSESVIQYVRSSQYCTLSN